MHLKKKKSRFNFGHLHSQKFAGFVFGTFVLVIAAAFLSVAQFSTLVMGVCGLYGAFVGGRAWSDNASLKYGGTVNTVDAETSVVKKLPNAEEKKEDDKDEID